MEKKTRFGIIYIFLALFGVTFIHDAWVSYKTVVELPYSEFQVLLNEGKVSEVVVTPREIQGELKDPVDGGKKHFVTQRVEPEIATQLDKHGVKFSAREENTFFRDLLGWILPVLFFCGFWFFLSSRMKGGDMGPGL